MTRPQRYLTRMAVFLAVVVLVVAVLFVPIAQAFMANPVLNGVIAGVLVLGIVYVFRQVLMLRQEVDWLSDFRRQQQPLTVRPPPRLLAPMATMLGERHGRTTLSTLSARSVLDSISSRLDESREISRYLIGLLIFLGLLGTFWGLLETVSSVGETIRALSPSGGDFGRLFDDLQRGLERPLSGMGTAFSSSLFGLSGSLVLGFLDLQAAQSQNRFYNDLEEWLAGITRVSSGGGPGELEGSVPAYVQALLEQTAESLENLQRTMARAEDSRGGSNAALIQLSERLATLTDQMRAEQELMLRLAENHVELQGVLSRMVSQRDSGALDQASRAHLRNLDVYVGRLLEELAEGRAQVVQEVRSEIKLLARTIAAIAEDERKG